MAVPPIQYRATDYPPEYRPLGYWRHARRRDESPGPAASPRSSRRWWAFLAVLLATLVLHAGIAFAYLSDSGSSTASSTAATPKGARCNQPGDPDPTVTSVPNSSGDIPDPGQGDEVGGGTGDPGSAGGGSSRGAL